MFNTKSKNYDSRDTEGTTNVQGPWVCLAAVKPKTAETRPYQVSY